MHKFKLQQMTKRFILPLVSLLTVVSIVFTSVRSYAEDPSAAIIHPFGSNNIVVRDKTNRNVTPWEREKNGNLLGKLRSFKDTLEIPGDKKSGANLNFISENTVVVDHAGLIARTVPSDNPTEYRFPCGLAIGHVTIGWREAGGSKDRACNQGLKVGPGVGKQSYRPNLNYRDGLQASKKILLAQSFSDVIVVPPDSGSRLIQVLANENAIETITLQGDILVKSDKHPQGRLIPEGNQYSYPKDTITPINCQGIANSPEIQELLNNNNWSYSDISQRVFDGIANQIAEHRSALCRASQSPVWTLDFPAQIYADCSIRGRHSMPVVQTGASLTGNTEATDNVSGNVNSPVYQTVSETLRGTLTEGKVQMVLENPLGYSMVFDGAIRPNGEIIGTVTLKGGICSGLSDSFKMTR